MNEERSEEVERALRERESWGMGNTGIFDAADAQRCILCSGNVRCNMY